MKKLYLGRSKCSGYELFTKNPNMFQKDDGATWTANGRLLELCVKEFHKCTNVRLKIGEVRNVSAIEFRFFEEK